MSRNDPVSTSSIHPFITVVVVFHTRLNFLDRATESVLRQTLTNDHYEILVVGPKRPQALVERTDHPRVAYVECTERGLGNKIATGIRNARGDVVAFLEDDDLFEPGKLAFVRDSFLSNPGLVYLQNGYRTIDETGQPILQKGPDERAMDRWSLRGTVAVSGHPTDSELRQFVRIPAGFNNSSIAVRRSTLRELLPLLETVDMLVDVALLYGSLVECGRLCLDPRILTCLRKHAASNSDPRLASDDEQLARLQTFSEAAQLRRRGLVDYVSARGSPAVVRAIEGQWDMGVLFHQLREARFTFSERARTLLGCLRRWETFEVQNYAPAVPLAALLMTMGGWGPRLYIRSRRRFYLKT